MSGAASLIKKIDADESILIPSAGHHASDGFYNIHGAYLPPPTVSSSMQGPFGSSNPSGSPFNQNSYGLTRGVSGGGLTPSMMYSPMAGGDFSRGRSPGGNPSPASSRLYSTSQQSGAAMLAAGGNTARSAMGGSRIISERVIEHSVRVPKRVTREDIFEKIIVVPERVVHEEVIEDMQTIREKIVEIAVPIISERVVEVPEIEYIERIVEVPEVIIREKIREVPRIEIRERIIEVPKIYTQERIVEVPDIEYREVTVEKIVEVPEIREQVVIKEIPVPQYVDKPVPEYVDVHEEQEIIRRTPVPVEAVTTCEFKLPRLRPHYIPVDIPLYVPRFVEVAVPQDMMHPSAIAQADLHIQRFNQMSTLSAVSLSEVEALAHEIKAANYDELLMAGLPREKQEQIASNLIIDNWMNGRLQIDLASMACTTAQKPDTFKTVDESLSSLKVGASVVAAGPPVGATVVNILPTVVSTVVSSVVPNVVPTVCTTVVPTVVPFEIPTTVNVRAEPGREYRLPVVHVAGVLEDGTTLVGGICSV